jgi:O-antigen/teichoic acid export membrane protein
LGAQLMWSAYSNSDYLIVGRLLGSTLLGYYTMAFELATKPISKVAEITNIIGFSLFSKLQDDISEIRLNFLRMTEIVALLLVPVLTGLFCVANELVTVVLTQKWSPMIFPFQALCIMSIFRALSPLITCMLAGRGRPDLVFRYNLVCTLVLPFSFVVGCLLGGLNGVAIAWLVTFPLIFLMVLLFGLRNIQLTIWNYFGALKTAVFATLAMLAIVLTLRNLLLGQVNNVWLLVIECTIGALTYLIVVFSISSWVRQQSLGALSYVKKLRLQKAAV